MFEKVNPSHPDKIADRIAGAIVDIAYHRENRVKIAVEVLIGHDLCTVIVEATPDWIITYDDVFGTVRRIAGLMEVRLVKVSQDHNLAKNQERQWKCGDNGIFKGMPVTLEQKRLTQTAEALYDEFYSDGKYILDGDKLVICQSNADSAKLKERYPSAIVNPLGDWTGGLDVDTGATNRKLGSDMGDSVTGGGLHGKDLSKADVSVNIYAWLKAQETGETVELSCAIGDETIDGKPYEDIVEIARKFIQDIGGFEKFAEWGLIR